MASSTFFLVIIAMIIEVKIVQSLSLQGPKFRTELSSTRTQLYSHSKDNALEGQKLDRRSLFVKTGKLFSVSAISPLIFTSSANAMSSKSRTDGYQVQYTEREWAYLLSGKQYNILRQGGTERPYSSILEGQEGEGEYVCAGCGTPLFTSSAKFHSGTGWPSYASALPGVEVEDVNPVQANLLGAEIRCQTCGGHLGDVFNDGFVYVGTPAFTSGKRFCVDGAALIFKPKDGSEDVFGDFPPPPSKKDLPEFLSPPKIQPRD